MTVIFLSTNLGNLTLVVSYIGYASEEINGLLLEPGETLDVGKISLGDGKLGNFVVTKGKKRRSRKKNKPKETEKVNDVPEKPTYTKAPNNTPPKIIINNPELSRGFTPVSLGKQTTIRGIVKSKIGVYEILVNGESVAFSEEGAFHKQVLLKVGVNKVTVTATDIHKNEVSEVFSIKRESSYVAPQTTNNTTQNSEVGNGRYYALIIAAEKYSDQRITQLDNPVSDARRLRSVLASRYGFSKNEVRFLSDPDKEEVTEALEWYYSELNNNDNLLIFYAGHGYWDDKFGEGYWLLSDANKDNRGTWLPNSTIKKYMKAIPSRHTLLITDACFAGGIFKTRNAFSERSVAIERLNSLPSRKALTSGALSEVPDESVFIKYLVKRLEHNTQKYISSEQLFASFKLAVINNSTNGQVPQFGEVSQTGDEGGDFIFIMNK